MSSRLRTGLVVAAALASTGVRPAPALAQSSADSSDVVLVVMAVKPACRVLVYEGELDGSGWRTTAPKAAGWARSEKGFVVFTLKPRTGQQAYAVGDVFPENLSAQYHAAPGGPVVVFHAVPGQVTFAGTLHLVPQASGATVALDETITTEQLNDFISIEHPELAGLLHFEPMQLLTGTGEARVTASTISDGAPSSSMFGPVFTGLYFGMSGGPSALTTAAEQRVNAGSGFSVTGSVGMTLWDHLPVNFSIGRLILDDKQPFTQTVVDCMLRGGTCSNPHEESSQIRSGVMLALESGYQHRFKIFEDDLWSLSVVPALLVGHVWTASEFSRGVACDGCFSVPVEGADIDGYYVGPSVKLAFGKWLALTARLEHFLTGDLSDRLLFGGELGRI